MEVLKGPKEVYPLDDLLTKLHSAKDLPFWLCYLKIAIPDDPALPVLIYGGSATSSTSLHTGGDERWRSHLSAMKNGTVPEDLFFSFWKEHSDRYTIYYLETWLDRSYNFRAEEAFARKAHRAVVHVAEAAVTKLFGTLSQQGTRTFLFPLPERQPLSLPCNKADPLENFWSKSGTKTRRVLVHAARDLSTSEIVEGILKIAG